MARNMRGRIQKERRREEKRNKKRRRHENRYERPDSSPVQKAFSDDYGAVIIDYHGYPESMLYVDPKARTVLYVGKRVPDPVKARGGNARIPIDGLECRILYNMSPGEVRSHHISVNMVVRYDPRWADGLSLGHIHLFEAFINDGYQDAKATLIGIIEKDFKRYCP